MPAVYTHQQMNIHVSWVVFCFVLFFYSLLSLGTKYLDNFGLAVFFCFLFCSVSRESSKFRSAPFNIHCKDLHLLHEHQLDYL